MIKNYKRIIVALAIIVLIAGLLSCNEGPMEHAGKKVDKAVEDVKK